MKLCLFDRFSCSLEKLQFHIIIIIKRLVLFVKNLYSQVFFKSFLFLLAFLLEINYELCCIGDCWFPWHCMIHYVTILLLFPLAWVMPIVFNIPRKKTAKIGGVFYYLWKSYIICYKYNSCNSVNKIGLQLFLSA